MPRYRRYSFSFTSTQHLLTSLKASTITSPTQTIISTHIIYATDIPQTELRRRDDDDGDQSTLDQLNDAAPDDVVVSEGSAGISFSTLKDNEKRHFGKRDGDGDDDSTLDQLNDAAPDDVVVSQGSVAVTIGTFDADDVPREFGKRDGDSDDYDDTALDQLNDEAPDDVVVSNGGLGFSIQ